MKSHSRRAALFSVCAALVFVMVLPAAAQFVPRVGYAADGGDAVVTVNDRTAVRFHQPNAGLTTVDRAQLTAGRLKTLVGGGWQSISVKALGKRRAQVVVGDSVICIATKADAKAARMSALGLAQTWAGRLKELFAMPPILVDSNEITVPERETRSVKIGGAALGLVAAETDSAKVATASVTTERKVVVRGTGVGRCTVSVSCQGCTTSFSVNVKRYAAKVARREVVEVTGNPAPASLLKLVASHAAARALAFEPGAAGSFGEPKVEADSLPRGKRTLAAIPVKVAGQGLISAQLTAPVEIVNRPLEYKAAGGLFYSNNPERVTQYGTLFAGRLDLDARHRLFYHHQNMMGKHMRLVIELINSGDGPAEVHTVSGTAPPHVDPVIGGYLAGMSFMRDYLGDIGRIHKIPGQTKLVLYSEVVGETRTASGIIDMRMLEGQDVFVKVSAAPDVSGQLSEGEMASVAAADVPTTLSDHVYSAPFKQVSASYTVGDRWEFVRIGKYAIKNGAGDKELYGNYGVIYEISIHMENPTADTRTVKILFEPTAGPASGIFVVNGRIVAVKVINPPNEFQITSVKLAPGQSKDLKITTIPLGGSAYPATILVKS